MNPRPRGPAALAFALAGAGLAAVDVAAGLIVDGGYTVGLAYLHLAVVIAGVVGVFGGVWQTSGRRDGDGPSLLLASCALLLGAQMPWSLSGLTGRPWFAIVGGAAAALLVTAVVLLSEWAPTTLQAPLAWAQRRRAASRPDEAPTARAGRTGAGPSGPGWYPDPDADATPCWRWWDGRGWTEHRSSGAAG